jgi:type IV fimbrial biogenesis protein FimT
MYFTPKIKTIKNKSYQLTKQGFTLIELLITILILSILLTVGIPSFISSFDKKRLITATEQVYGHLQQARIESISRSNDVTVTFAGSGTTAWVYGYAESSAVCDTTKTSPTDVNACIVIINDVDAIVHGLDGYNDNELDIDNDDKVLKRVVGADFTDVNMVSTVNKITFSPLRGLADTGNITFTSGLGEKLKIKVSALGMIKVCAPTGSSVGMYSADSSC